MDCASGFCVDSVCCDTSIENCNGDCEACNLAGTIGYCTTRANLDNTEVTPTCYYCNGTNETSVVYTGESGVNCVTDCYDCSNGSCLAVNDVDDGSCNTNCTHCVSGSCNNYSDGTDCETGDLCKECFSGICGFVAAGTSATGCTTTHYRCDGAGLCTCPLGPSQCVAYNRSSCAGTCGAMFCASGIWYSNCGIMYANWGCAPAPGYYEMGSLQCRCNPYIY